MLMGCLKLDILDDFLPCLKVVYRADDYKEKVGVGGNVYLYNGKEKVGEVIGLDLLDYGFRYYDPAIARFTTVDPLAETYSFQSGYAYAVNNPVLFRDIMGLGVTDWVKNKKSGDIYWDDAATSHETTKDGDDYLGKEVSVTESDGLQFNYHSDKTFDNIYSGATVFPMKEPLVGLHISTEIALFVVGGNIEFGYNRDTENGDFAFYMTAGQSTGFDFTAGMGYHEVTANKGFEVDPWSIEGVGGESSVGVLIFDYSRSSDREYYPGTAKGFGHRDNGKYIIESAGLSIGSPIGLTSSRGYTHVFGSKKRK